MVIGCKFMKIECILVHYILYFKFNTSLNITENYLFGDKGTALNITDQLYIIQSLKGVLQKNSLFYTFCAQLFL